MGEIKITDCNIGYKKNSFILNNLNLNFKSGHIYGLIGRNGAGKTTLIKHLLNQSKYFTGSISIDNIDMTDKSFYDFDIGYLLEPILNKEITLEKMIKYYSSIKQRKASAELLDILNIRQYMKKKIKTLSFGNIQKIALYQCLMFKPNIIILDEPLIGLDPQSIKELKEYLIKLKNDGHLIIISNHQLEETKDLCDEYYIVRDQTVKKGTVEEFVKDIYE